MPISWRILTLRIKLFFEFNVNRISMWKSITILIFQNNPSRLKQKSCLVNLMNKKKIYHLSTKCILHTWKIVYEFIFNTLRAHNIILIIDYWLWTQFGWNSITGFYSLSIILHPMNWILYPEFSGLVRSVCIYLNRKYVFNTK